MFGEIIGTGVMSLRLFTLALLVVGPALLLSFAIMARNKD